MSEFIHRIKRTIEIGKTFGWLDRLTWKTLFPPFRGWDVGCGYCRMEAGALEHGACSRYEQMGTGSYCGI